MTNDELRDTISKILDQRIADEITQGDCITQMMAVGTQFEIDRINARLDALENGSFWNDR